jgi:hypothetical protein
MNAAEEGDTRKFDQAYHNDAWEFGEAAGGRHDKSIKSFSALSEQQPLGKAGNYEFRIVSVTQVGNAAMAMVVESGCWGSVSFVDLFTLTRMDGTWKITNKTYTVTGGEIPEEVLAAAASLA